MQLKHLLIIMSKDVEIPSRTQVIRAKLSLNLKWQLNTFIDNGFLIIIPCFDIIDCLHKSSHLVMAWTNMMSLSLVPRCLNQSPFVVEEIWDNNSQFQVHSIATVLWPKMIPWQALDKKVNSDLLSSIAVQPVVQHGLHYESLVLSNKSACFKLFSKVLNLVLKVDTLFIHFFVLLCLTCFFWIFIVWVILVSIVFLLSFPFSCLFVSDLFNFCLAPWFTVLFIPTAAKGRQHKQCLHSILWSDNTQNMSYLLWALWCFCFPTNVCSRFHLGPFLQ